MPPPLSENQKDAAREVISLFTRLSILGFAVGAVLLGWAFSNWRIGERDTLTDLGFAAAVFIITFSFFLVGVAIYFIFRIWRSK